MSNMFNVLYHRYIQQIKLQQIQTYNNKHKQYLQRCGKYRHQKLNPQNNHHMAQKNRTKKINQQRTIKQRNSNISNQNLQNENSVYKSRQRNQKLNTRNQKEKLSQNGYYQSKNIPQAQQQRPIKPYYEKGSKSSNNNQFSGDSTQTHKQINSKNLNNNLINSHSSHYGNQQQNERAIKPVLNNYKNNSLLQQYPQSQQGNITLEQCPQGCGRKFNPQALEKHIKICQKIFQGKRKPFKVDVVDDQAKKLAQKNQRKTQKTQTNKPNTVPKWKKQSENFRRGLQATKDGGSAQSLPIQQDDRIKCGGCGRKFNQKAAQKHIPNCEKRKLLKR